MSEEKRQLEALFFEIKEREKETPRFEQNLKKHLFENFPNFLLNLPNDEYGKNSTKMERRTIDGQPQTSIGLEGDFFFGKISTTKFGKKDKIVDTDDKENDDPIFETNGTSQGIEKVFFFFMGFDKSQQRGLILLEKKGVNGIVGVFRKTLKQYFNNYFSDYKIEVKTYYDKEAIKELVENGVARSLTLKTNKISNDTADNLRLTETTDDYEYTLTIKKKGNRSFFGSNTREIIRRLYDDKNKSYIISETLKDAGFDETSDVSVNFEYDNLNKNVSLEEFKKIPRSIYNIYVNVDEYGNSDFQEMREITINKFDQINPF